MTIDKLGPEDQIIFYGTKLNPSANDLVLIDTILRQINSLDYVHKKATACYLAPLLLHNLRQLPDGMLIAKDIVPKLKGVYLLNKSKNTAILEAYSFLSKILTKNNVDHIPLKGIAMLNYIYKDIALRSVGDIDLLIRAEEIEKIIDILKNENIQFNYLKEEWMPFEFGNIHHPLIAKIDEFSVEFHIHVQKKYSSTAICIDDFWKRAILSDQPNQYQLALCDQLIHQCTHLCKHFANNDGLKFSWFNDIREIIYLFNENPDWNLISNLWSQYDCRREVKTILRICRIWFKAEIPDDVIILEKDEIRFYSMTENLFLAFLEGDTGNQNKLNTAFRHRFYNKHEINALIKSIGIINKAKLVFSLFFPPRKLVLKSVKKNTPLNLLRYYYRRILKFNFALARYVIESLIYRSYINK